MNIVICEHDETMLNTVVEWTNKMMQNDKLEASAICITTKLCEARQFIWKNKASYLFFIDYSLVEGNFTAIDFARLVKTEMPFSKVVFTTYGTKECLHILKSGVEVFGAIDRGTDMLKMRREYAHYIALASKAMKNVTAFGAIPEPRIKLQIEGDGSVSIPASQIAYVEAEKTIPHFIRYHTIDGSSILARDTLEHAVELLGDGFIKSHRSSAINKRYVVGVEDGFVKLSNGASAACAIKRKSAVVRECLC